MLFRVARSKISTILVFTLLLSTLMPIMALGATVQFKDVADSYAQKEIQALVGAGIISGYEDGTFQPRKAMTRAELAKMIVLSLGLIENPDKASSFRDVDATSWYRGYVGALVESKITEGTSATTFSPDANVTREELVVFFLRGFGLDETAKKLKADAELSDLNQVSDWAKGHVSLAFKMGFVNGNANADGSLKFAPKENAERQALARLAYEFKTNKTKFIDKAKEVGKTEGVAVEILEITAVTVVSSTSVEVTFNQELAVVSKDDFKFDNNLTVTNAELKAGNKKVVVLTTSSQALNTTYKLSYKGKDTGKSFVGNPGSTGGGGGGGAVTTPVQTDAQKINAGGTVNGNLTVASSDVFGPASGTPTTINGNLIVGTGGKITATVRNVVVNGNLTLNPSGEGQVTLQNVTVQGEVAQGKGTVEVLSGSSTSIKLLQTVVKQLRVNVVSNGGKTVRIAAQEGTTVDEVSVESDVIVESESSTGTLSKIKLSSAAAGKSISLRGNIDGEITSEADGVNITLDPPTTGTGTTSLNKLNLLKSANIKASNGTVLSSVNVNAPNTKVSFTGQGAVSNVIVDANAGDSSLEFSADSNVQGVDAAASFKVKGDADKIINLNVKTSGNVAVSVDNTVQPSQAAQDNAKQKAIEAIDAIGQLPNEYSKDVETKISFAQNKVRLAEKFGVSLSAITNYSNLTHALTWLASFQATNAPAASNIHPYNFAEGADEVHMVGSFANGTIIKIYDPSGQELASKVKQAGDDSAGYVNVIVPNGYPDSITSIAVTLKEDGKQESAKVPVFVPVRPVDLDIDTVKVERLINGNLKVRVAGLGDPQTTGKMLTVNTTQDGRKFSDVQFQVFEQVVIIPAAELNDVTNVYVAYTQDRGESYRVTKAIPSIPAVPTVTGFTYYDVTASSVTLSWHPVFFDGIHSSTVFYAVYENGGRVALTDAIHATISGLNADTEYSFTIYTLADGKASAPVLPELVVRTLSGAAVVPTVTGFTYSNVTTNSVQLSWNPVIIPGIPVTYAVYKNGTQHTVTETTYTTISGLSTGVDYEFRVYTLVNGESSLPAVLYPVTLPGSSEYPAPTLSGVAFTDGAGGVTGGKTKINLPAAAEVGNTFAYKISVDGQPIATPKAGENASGWTSVTDGTEIYADHGVHIGVAEVKAGKIISFVNLTAVAEADVADVSLEGANQTLETVDGKLNASFTWKSTNGIGSDSGYNSGAYTYYNDGSYLRFQVKNAANTVVKFADVFVTGAADNNTVGGMTLQTDSGTINDMDGSNRERADWGVADMEGYKTNLPNSGQYVFYGVIQNNTVGTKTVGFEAGNSRTVNMTLTPKAGLAPGTYTLVVEAMQQGRPDVKGTITYTFVVDGAVTLEGAGSTLVADAGKLSASFTWRSANGIGSDSGYVSGAYTYYNDGSYLRFQVKNTANTMVKFADVFETGAADNNTEGGMTLQTNDGAINDMDGSNRERADWGVADLEGYKTNLPNSGQYVFYGVIQNNTLGTKTVGFAAGDSRTVNMTLTPKAGLAPGAYTVVVETLQQGNLDVKGKITYTFLVN